MESHVFATRPCGLLLAARGPPLFQKCCQPSQGGEKKKKPLVLRGVYTMITRHKLRQNPTLSPQTAYTPPPT